MKELGAREVHVWLVSLDVSPAQRRRLASLLSADERERATRYRAAPARDRFVVARTALREILGRYARLPPERLRFGYPCACGRADCEPSRRKPRLELETHTVPLRFNVSHADGLAMIAVSRGREVGVDVERIRPGIEIASVASWILGANEAGALAALPDRERLDAFYRSWTRWEAHAKARGDGRSPPDERDGENGPWWFGDLTPAPGYRAALAVEGGACLVRTCWWSDARPAMP